MWIFKSYCSRNLLFPVLKWHWAWGFLVFVFCLTTRHPIWTSLCYIRWPWKWSENLIKHSSKQKNEILIIKGLTQIEQMRKSSLKAAWKNFFSLKSKSKLSLGPALPTPCFFEKNLNPQAVGWDSGIPFSWSNFLGDIFQPKSSRMPQTSK